jgi:hypothetical protein
MRLLKLALENQRWDLAAHVIVLASARVLSTRHHKNKRRSEERPNVSSEREKKGCPQGQPER